MGEGGFRWPSALSLFRFHLSPFPQKRLILRLPPANAATQSFSSEPAGGAPQQVAVVPGDNKLNKSQTPRKFVFLILVVVVVPLCICCTFLRGTHFRKVCLKCFGHLINWQGKNFLANERMINITNITALLKRG